MKTANLLVCVLVLAPLLYVGSIVPIIWLSCKDLLPAEACLDWYRPLSLLRGSQVGAAVDWYASLVRTADGRGFNPGTYLNWIAWVNDDA